MYIVLTHLTHIIFCILTKYKVLIEKGSKECLRFLSMKAETPSLVDVNILFKINLKIKLFINKNEFCFLFEALLKVIRSG